MNYLKFICSLNLSLLFRISYCSEAGIYQKWKVLNDLSIRLHGLRKTRALNLTLNSESSSVSKISLLMVQDIFIWTGFGLLIAFLSLIIEPVYHKILKTQNI